MAVDQVSAYVARALYWSFNGVQLEGVQNFSGMTPTGSVPEIDVSDMSSESRQFEPGISDPGNTSLSAILDPSTPAYQELVNSSRNGLIYELRMVVGAKAANSPYTDGSPIQTSLFPSKTGAKPDGLTAAAGSLSVAKDQAGLLKAVKPGHYLGVGTGGAQNYRKITAISVASTGIVTITATGLVTGDVVNGEQVQVVKPAWEIRRLAYVSSLGHDGAIDAAITTPLEFRNSGDGATNVGTPSITI